MHVLKEVFGLRMMDNLMCEETFERNALGNKNGGHKLENPRVKLESIGRMIEEIRNSYKEMIEGLNAVRASLYEQNEFLNALESLSKEAVTKERVILDEKENLKGIESLGKDGLKGNKKCNKPRREDGVCVEIIGGDIKSPSKRNEYPGYYEDLRKEEMLKVRDFENESMRGNF